eukprot:5638415-Amphidinium_carterae.1
MDAAPAMKGHDKSGCTVELTQRCSSQCQAAASLTSWLAEVEIVAEPSRKPRQAVHGEECRGRGIRGYTLWASPHVMHCLNDAVVYVAGADGSSYADAVKWEVEFAYHAGAYRICLCLVRWQSLRFFAPVPPNPKC